MTRLFVRPISSSHEEVPPVSEQIYDWSRKALSASVDDALDFVSDAPYVTGINCVIGRLQEAFRDVAVFFRNSPAFPAGWSPSALKGKTCRSPRHTISGCNLQETCGGTASSASSPPAGTTA